MSSERQVGRGLAGALLALLMTVAGNVAADAPTWRGLDQLTDDERAQLDFATNTPRDAKLDYLPAEAWPFKAPYTAEEMGYRAAEFVHISRWPHSLVDVFGVITSSGYISQGAGVTYIHQNVKPGFESYMHDLPAGQVYSRWLIYSTFPPQTEAEQQLWVPYRTDVKNPPKWSSTSTRRACEKCVGNRSHGATSASRITPRPSTTWWAATRGSSAGQWSAPT